MVDPYVNSQKVKSIYYFSGFNRLTKKNDNTTEAFETGVIDKGLLRYLRRMKEITYQGMIFATKAVKEAS